MSQRDAFNGVLTSLNDAMLNDALWPATSALIDEACGSRGNGLYITEGTVDDAKVVFGKIYYRGQCRDEIVRDYLQFYHPHDERVPRLRRLPYNRLVHVTDLYTEQELKTSPTFNEALRRFEGQNSLNVRLDGLDGCQITWAIENPVRAGSWESDQIDMIQRLLPHVRQFVRVRQALATADAVATSLPQLLDHAGVGVIQMDRRGMIVAANDLARAVLRKGDGLSDRGGFLEARLPADAAGLKRLLADALPTFDGQSRGGSMTVRRSPNLPRLVVHVSPVNARQMDFGAQRVAALVHIVEPWKPPRIDPDHVAAALDLTPAQSRVATLLAEGESVRDIVAATGRTENSIRWHIKRIHRKLGISRQADMVRLVLSAGGELSRPRQ